MPIIKKTLNTRLDDLSARFGQTAAELRIKTKSEVGGAVALRDAIFSGATGKEIVLPNVDQLDEIVGVLELTPASAGVKNAAIAVFDPETTNPMLQMLQGDVADAIVTGVIGLGAAMAGRDDLKAQINVLLNTVLSVDDMSRGIRDLFSGRGGLGAHEIPRDILDRLEQLQKSACFAGVRNAMNGLAGAINAETPTFNRNQQIFSITPNDACPGGIVRIEGVGFGAAQDDQQVLFTGVHRISYVVATDIRTWSDTAIEVVVPMDAGRGPVAVAKPSDRGAAGTVATAASELAGEMAACFGKAASGAVGRLQDMKAVPVTQPPMRGHNFFGGGPPEIRSFTLAGRTGNTIWPNGSLTLSWKVDGATKITITPEQVGNQTNELPPIPGGLPPEKGSYKVTGISGSSKWIGAYRLVASNKCGKHEGKVEVVMARRVGFALSGGGSRGVFQLGVLDYLYNVKGIRPDGIASTSVGSVNALQLVMGDSPAEECRRTTQGHLAWTPAYIGHVGRGTLATSHEAGGSGHYQVRRLVGSCVFPANITYTRCGHHK